VLYQGHWPVVRDFVNILDKGNWGLFGIYSIILFALSLLIVPGLIYLLAIAGQKLSDTRMERKVLFLKSTGVLLPIGMALWIAFVIPMLFVNVTFIIQSLSDPFGWGWDFFGTSNIPWHQFLPRLTPWLQSGIILTGSYFGLRNLRNTWSNEDIKEKQLFFISLPMGLFILAASVMMIFFFTN
jgi:hypothetical protein